jgi:hypothetical protein
MKGLQIPERFTGKVYIYAYSDPTSYLYGDLCLFNFEVGSDDRILVGEAEIDVPLDHASTLDKQVEQLRTAKKKILSDATDKARQLDEAIESLLAIEYKGATA